MKNRLLIILLLSLMSNYLFCQTKIIRFDKSASFFPDEEILIKEDIEWGYLSVPENWNKLNGKTIKIAVAVLKCRSKNKNPDPVVYIPGGPGAGGIDGILGWINHPLRMNSDIILLDPRGTGFSLPRFCPVLGRAFLEILAKNQNSSEDERQKAMVAMECRQELINKDIDLESYNSDAISKDLNALKNVLHYKSWNVYGVSYGTYIAQVYVNYFPADIKSLVLDSPVSDITKYYNENTSNYMSSLSKVFSECRNDPKCDKEYPDLENIYYKTIKELSRNPLTVKVNKKIISTGKFTYNSEDFKIAVHQSLYNKNLIELIPLLINEFYKRNTNTLSSLVESFSRSLSLDYGLYYCVTCNEVIPFNSLSKFNNDAKQFKKIDGGLSFYKSDFLVCEKWNTNLNTPASHPYDLSNLSAIKSPVMIFSGEFDPITPFSNGRSAKNKFKNGRLIVAPAFGHAPGFSDVGKSIVANFERKNDRQTAVREFNIKDKVNFLSNIKINGGVSNFAKSIKEINIFFAAPIVTALLIILLSFFYDIYLLLKRKSLLRAEIIMKTLLSLATLFGVFFISGLIMALVDAFKINFYILAFGVTDQFENLFFIQWIFLFFTFISLLFFVLKATKISNGTVVFTVLFSLIILNIYIQYWGFLF